MSRSRLGVRAETIHALGRFVLVGATNTSLSFVVFHATLPLFGDRGLGPATAQAVSFAAGALLSFGLNRRWTFRSRGAVRRQLPRFAASQFALLLLSSVIVDIGVARLRLPATPCWVFAVGVVTVCNFALQRLWVFEAHRTGATPSVGAS